ncbi:MAG: formylglycine-generating enzyme family protein [Rhodobacteraceae bacterium]|nr:formylglycine-generating enzyme family protein [Paracoccaceae bacterium]
MSGCCPSRGGDRRPTTQAVSDCSERNAPPRLQLKGGRVMIGTADTILPQDGEKPPRQKRVKPFAIDPIAVTNDRFADFVAATGYVTEAEPFGWSFVFQGFLDPLSAYQRLPGAEWWCRVEGADWRRPEGPGSDLAGRGDHPVVHVSWHDAVAFARWAGGRLPSEAEWEYAARGGLEQRRYPWGDEEPDDTGFQPCNIWQGRFPHANTAADGFAGTAPAESFAPNGFGLFNMVGNTWEWTADIWRIRSLRKTARNPAVPTAKQYVLKGGSYLCHKSYCYRYRIAARTPNTPDSSTGHTGFRLVYDPGSIG